MVEWIISSSVLIVVIIILRFVLKGKISLRLQYALWSLVLVRLLLPVSIGNSSISIMNQVEQTTIYQETAQTVTEIQVPSDIIRDSELTYEEAKQAGNGTLHRVEGYPSDGEKGNLHTYSYWDSLQVVGTRILRIVWICGITAVGLWFVISNLRLLHSLKKSRTLLTSNHELPVYLSDVIDTPCLFGLFHPAIYLTSEAVESETTMRHAVEHELTHYYHKDNIWAILRSVCLAVHWYNPLVWVAAVLSRNDSELACDESTIRRLGENERVEYGRTLIRLTCEKRPALLNTATTMTGSGKSIKERIALIVKKPKMAIYTLVAVILIVALAVGCTFTGAKDEGGEIDAGLWPEDAVISCARFEYAGDKGGYKLITSEIAQFDSLRSMDLIPTEGDFAGDIVYRLILNWDGIIKDATEYTILVGKDSLSVNGKLYKADGYDFSKVLDYFEGKYQYFDYNLLFDDFGEIEISIPSQNVPDAVIDYAKDHVREIIDYLNECGGKPLEKDKQYTIKAARITNIEQINTGTAGLNDGINLYRLEYRLQPDYPENVPAPGGMIIEDGWITEWNSAGQPYLLLHYKDSGDETIWTPICVTNTEVIGIDYGTPEMLEKYGSKYTAVAMELYAKYQDQLEEEARSAPGTAIYELFDAAGNMTITLYLANEGACNAYAVTERWYAERFDVLMMGYEWMEIEMPNTAPSEYWLTAESSNGKKKMTFWSGDAGMIQYDDGSTTTYWVATPLYESSASIAYDIRREYDNLDVDFSRIAFYQSGSAEDAANKFVHSVYGSHKMNLAPGNWYGISEYAVINWDVREVSEDGTAVVGWFEYAFVPWDMESSGIWAGNTSLGTGKYEGMLTAYLEFVLEEQKDGYWLCIGLGTGGYQLPRNNILTGYITIEDGRVYLDEVEIITQEDAARIEELGLSYQRDLISGYYIYNEDEETIAYQLFDETVYRFVDIGQLYTSEEGLNYETISLEEFLAGSSYAANAAPNESDLPTGRIPYFVEVEGRTVISITEDFSYTI